jgi:hypothetical protein
MTTEHNFAFPRRNPPESCPNLSPEIRGRRESRVSVEASRAKIESTQASHHGHTGFTRHSPRNGFNGLLRALPGDRLFVTSTGAMRKHPRRFDASVEASGPHGFAVRSFAVRLSTLPRPPHPAPNVL